MKVAKSHTAHVQVLHLSYDSHACAFVVIVLLDDEFCFGLRLECMLVNSIGVVFCCVLAVSNIVVAVIRLVLDACLGVRETFV